MNRPTRERWWPLAMMAGAWLAAPVPGWSLPPPGYEPADDGHIDFVFCFVGGVWNYGLIWDRTGNPLHTGPAVGTLMPAEMVPIIARDQPYPTGSRANRPAGDEWAFVGVTEGQPFWWFPQIRTGAAWPGFAVCGDCGSYFEDDPRVMAASSWKTLDLKRVRYRGLGRGHYSLWTSGTFGELTVWMSTAEGGITADDRFYVSSAGHAHAAMGFSDLGLYEVTFTTTCYGGPGKTRPATSPEVSFHFAVGTYWEWVARHFQPERWWQDISLEASDADGDSIPNLVEYACGLNPRQPDPRPHERGEVEGGLPALEIHPSFGRGVFHFPMRRPHSHPQVTTVVESSSLDGGSLWIPESAAEESTQGDWSSMAFGFDFPPFGPPARIIRLSLTLQDAIDYEHP